MGTLVQDREQKRIERVSYVIESLRSREPLINLAELNKKQVESLAMPYGYHGVALDLFVEEFVKQIQPPKPARKQRQKREAVLYHACFIYEYDNKENVVALLYARDAREARKLLKTDLFGQGYSGHVVIHVSKVRLQTGDRRIQYYG